MGDRLMRDYFLISPCKPGIILQFLPLGLPGAAL